MCWWKQTRITSHMWHVLGMSHNMCNRRKTRESNHDTRICMYYVHLKRELNQRPSSLFKKQSCHFSGGKERPTPANLSKLKASWVFFDQRAWQLWIAIICSEVLVNVERRIHWTLFELQFHSCLKLIINQYIYNYKQCIMLGAAIVISMTIMEAHIWYHVYMIQNAGHRCEMKS